MKESVANKNFSRRIILTIILLVCIVFSFQAQAQSVSSPIDKRVSSLSFSWNIPVGMAVFWRGNHLWIVFDQHQPLNVEALNREIAPFGKNLFQLPYPNATIVRLTPEPGTHVHIRKEGFLWIVDLSYTDFNEETDPLQIFIQTNSIQQPYIFIPTTAAGKILSFIDPEIGDNLVIAPVTAIGKFVLSEYSYPDVELLATRQGVAILPKSSDLAFSRGNNGITIRSEERGLHISPDLDILKRRELLLQTDDDISSLMKELPLDMLDKNFRETVTKLKQAIDAAHTEEDKNLRRYDLAKYYIGKGMGVEAIALLKIIEAANGPDTKKEKFHDLYGVANFLARRYPEALERFSYGRLMEVNADIFWRAVTETAINPSSKNNIIILSFFYIMKDYPEIIKDRIARVAVEAALLDIDDISVQNFIDILKNSFHAHKYETLVTFLTGQQFIIQNHPRNALQEFRKAAIMPDQKYSSLARFEVAMMEYQVGTSTADKKIPELERLRFAWGDRAFKIKLLENLATLYEKTKDYSNALHSLNLAIYLGNKEQNVEFTKRMISLFEDISIHNQADSLPPLKIISLYTDFSWLAPLSSRYNDIIQNIADRLIAVDLIDRAAEILTNQLKYNTLSDVQRAQSGARLALTYLFRDGNTEAIQILNETDSDDLPEAIKSSRLIIHAKALSNMGEDSKALALLGDDNSRSAILLKSEIHWNAENWGQAADELGLLVDKPESDKTLTKEQINFVLDWITALRKSGRDTVIVRIKNTFTPLFKDTPYFSTFNVLTNRLETDSINMGEISQVVRDAKAFSNFSRLYIDSLIKEEQSNALPQQ